MKKEEVLFFFSALFFLLSGLLYAWGTPDWFILFPYSAGFRFLLSLEVYFLSCAVFFSLRLASFTDGKKHAFMMFFILAFAAIPAFSALVIFNAPIQILQTFLKGLDLAGWLTIAVLSFRKSPRDRFLLAVLFVATGLFLAVPVIPSIVLLAARFTILTVFSARGLRMASSPVTDSPLQEVTGFREAAERFGLSPRETEVLALLISGRTNKEISQALFVSLSTVKTHIASIFAKTGARNRLEAAALCRKE